MTDERDPNARIDTHEAVCAERYNNIFQFMSDIKEDLAENKSDIKGLYSRFWTIAAATVGVLITVIILLVRIIYA